MTVTQEIHKAGTDDGWHGVIEVGGRFPPEAGRYHLYIGLFCPFAHRVNIVRHLFGLTDAISLSVCMPYPKPWVFPKTNDDYPNATIDHLFNSPMMKDIYFKADPEYKGKYSVPLLWDKKSGTIVNNESAELLRWLPTAFTSVVAPPRKEIALYPDSLREKIDILTPLIQSHINTGVYKAGFATDQESYSKAIPPVFGALNYIEALIHTNGGPYVLGKKLTELDVRLFATIVRFDAVYVQHFKCNLGTIRHDYPVLNAWLKNLFWSEELKAFRDTTDFKHIKENYTKSHHDINPLKITPLGPYPNVEEGGELDVGKLTPGIVKQPDALAFQKKFEEEYKI